MSKLCSSKLAKALGRKKISLTASSVRRYWRLGAPRDLERFAKFYRRLHHRAPASSPAFAALLERELIWLSPRSVRRYWSIGAPRNVPGFIKFYGQSTAKPNRAYDDAELAAVLAMG